MPYRRLPNSLPAVLRTLKAARDQYQATTNAADRALTAAQFAQLDDAAPADPADPPSLLARLLKEASEADIALAQQAPLTTALAQAGAQLTMFASHFHQVLDLGVTRRAFQSGARSYYGRDVAAGAIPALTSYDAVQEAAEAIVKGEADRQTSEGANFTAMSNPTAAEVASALAAFKTARAASKAAQEHTDLESEDVKALYAQAQALAVDVCDTVEFFYRKDPDDGSRRSKCQRWGVVYIYEPTEPQPAPTPTPTPPTT